jgi:hypothetical protein
LKGSACAETNDDWVRHRRMELYHSSMDHIIADINREELCSKDMYLRFADGHVRCSRAIYHLLVMDGQEVGAALIEINMWMWRYGRTFPRQISVDQAVEFCKKRVQESRARGAETVWRRRDAAWAKGASALQ